MHLAHVDIQAYRSLYEVALVPGDFTVLVGPNNAGKTNLADSLEFLGQIANNGLEVAVSREGGYENLAFRRQRRTRRPVRFAFTAILDASEIGPRYSGVRIVGKAAGPITVDYAFELGASSESRDADFSVSSERLTISPSTPKGRKRVTVRLERRDDRVQIRLLGGAGLSKEDPRLQLIEPFDDEHFEKYVQRSIDPTALVMNRLAFNPIVADLLEQLGHTRLFQLTPVECRKPGSSTPSPELERHGGNLPGVVRYMQRNHPDAWDATLEAMRRIIPGLSGIDTEFTTSRRLALLFHETGARAWTSEEVSDGTIQSLALFTALFDPRIPLVLIEEPENSVHPWIQKTFVDACRDHTRKQVVLTSHSPALISYLRPSELQIMWRSDDGRTHICPLDKIDPEAPRLWEQGELDLYELIDGGWIREAVPPGLQ